MLPQISLFKTIFNDAPQPWQLGFQDSACPGFTGIVELHNIVFFFLVVISVGVFWVLGSVIYNYSYKNSPIVHKYLNHGTLIELIWTITPAFVLIAIAFPSFRLLYLLDEVVSPTITIKVVGFLLVVKIKDGLKSYLLNKIKDTHFPFPPEGRSERVLTKRGSSGLRKLRPSEAANPPYFLLLRCLYFGFLKSTISSPTASQPPSKGREGARLASQAEGALWPSMTAAAHGLQKDKTNKIGLAGLAAEGWGSKGQKNIKQKEYKRAIIFLSNNYPITQTLNFLYNYKPFQIKAKYQHNVSNKINVLNYCFGAKQFFHSRSRAINRIGPHHIDVISVIFGLLLGRAAGYASYKSGEGVRITIKQSIIHKEYLFRLYYFFFNRGYCSNLEPRKYIRTLRSPLPKDAANGSPATRGGVGLKNKIYYGYEFNTYTFRSFVWIFNSFYNKGKKRIPLFIENFFTPLTLAIWINEEGSWTTASTSLLFPAKQLPRSGEAASGGVRISCNNFTLVEVEYLIKILKFKFNLNCNIQKRDLNNKYSIYIKKDSINNLKKLILPYLDKSMFYKLGSRFDL
jgi:LAGLIDADG DNA endonuclease family/Cytochrome C oxidase subunit II, transmembrane domain